MASYDFNRILMGTAGDSFSWERFFRELGLAALARKALGAMLCRHPCKVVRHPAEEVLQTYPATHFTRIPPAREGRNS